MKKKVRHDTQASLLPSHGAASLWNLVEQIFMAARMYFHNCKLNSASSPGVLDNIGKRECRKDLVILEWVVVLVLA